MPHKTSHATDEKIRFTAQKDCQLCGCTFAKGDEVEITLARDWDETEGQGEGGPWGWGGYTSRLLDSISSEIVDLGTNYVVKGGH